MGDIEGRGEGSCSSNLQELSHLPIWVMAELQRWTTKLWHAYYLARFTSCHNDAVLVLAIARILFVVIVNSLP